MNPETFRLFEQVLANTRKYFVCEYYAGTREMIFRYVCKQLGDVPPAMVSAALRVLRDSNAIIYDKKVWWFLADR